jgi:hypothetical protein
MYIYFIYYVPLKIGIFAMIPSQQISISLQSKLFLGYFYMYVINTHTYRQEFFSHFETSPDVDEAPKI